MVRHGELAAKAVLKYFAIGLGYPIPDCSGLEKRNEAGGDPGPGHHRQIPCGMGRVFFEGQRLCVDDCGRIERKVIADDQRPPNLLHAFLAAPEAVTHRLCLVLEEKAVFLFHSLA